MQRYFTGDELGNIKSISCSQVASEDSDSGTKWDFDTRIAFANPALAEEGSNPKSSSIEKLDICESDGRFMLASARTNGHLSAFSVHSSENSLQTLGEWKEPRFDAKQKFVGLAGNREQIFWCTSNGALGSMTIGASDASEDQSPDIPGRDLQRATLPMRLRAWRLSSSAHTFAYGGDEVDLSLWDTNRAFSETSTTAPSADPKKRKRNNELLPAEIWRAKNLPNDSLNLRQPIHITSLSYLSLPCSDSNAHIATGTLLGDVRRYDTRAARKPVANWKGIGKNGGVSVVQSGRGEHELYVADNGSNMSALDVRNGKVIYSYQKLAGTVTGASPSPNGFLGSTARDRFFRLHSTFPPPSNERQQQEQRGQVLGSVYMKSVPTAVVYDLSNANTSPQKVDETKDDDDDDVWDGMDEVDDSDGDDDSDNNGKKRTRT